MQNSSTNVLYLTMNPNRQSTTEPLEYWIENLDSQGLTPVIVVNSKGDLERWSKKLNIPTYIVSLDHPDKFHLIKLFLQIVSLTIILWKHKIDIIHCNEQNILPVGKLLSNFSHLPIVVSVHFTMNHAFCAWAFRGAKYLKKVFFVSNASLELTRRNLEEVVDPPKWTVLKNAIKLNDYRYDCRKRELFIRQLNIKDELVVGVACALRPRKQVEHLIQAVSQIKSKNIIVLVAGNYLPEDFEYGENLIQESKNILGDQVIFLGHLDELVGFYSSLDLFINTSVEEACSLSVLQALACSCPVVGYSSKDTVSEQVLPGGGEIVPQDDIQSLSKAIERFLNDEQLRLNARVAARKRVEDDYDSVKQSDLLMKAYQEILSGPK